MFFFQEKYQFKIPQSSIHFSFSYISQLYISLFLILVSVSIIHVMCSRSLLCIPWTLCVWVSLFWTCTLSRSPACYSKVTAIYLSACCPVLYVTPVTGKWVHGEEGLIVLFMCPLRRPFCPSGIAVVFSSLMSHTTHLLFCFPLQICPSLLGSEKMAPQSRALAFIEELGLVPGWQLMTSETPFQRIWCLLLTSTDTTGCT